GYSNGRLLANHACFVGRDGIPRRVDPTRLREGRSARLRDVYGPVMVLALALSASAQTQSDDDATALVTAAAMSARTVRTWRVEGTLTTAGADGHNQSSAKFHIAYQPPRYARLEVSDGDTPLFRVCDGTVQRTYYSDLKGFVRVLLP